MNLGRKELLLGVLVLVLVFVVGRQILTSTGVVGGARTPEARQADVGAARALISALPAVQVASVDPTTDATYSPSRDIFDYARCPEDIEAQRRRQEQQKAAELARQNRAREENKKAVEAAQRRRETSNPTPAGPVAPNPKFEYIAYMGELDDLGRPQIAVFEKGRGREIEILIARVGEVVEQDFVVRLIDWDRVELGFTDPKFSDQKKKLDRKDL